MALVELNLKPTKRELDQFGLGATLIYGLLGWWIWTKKGFLFWTFPGAAPTVAIVLWVIAGLCLLDSLAGYLLRSKVQVINRPVFLATTILLFPIGFVLSWVLLGVFFYGILTPVGLFFKLTGRDALERRLEPSAKTYWKKCRPVKDSSRYFKQF